MKWLKDRRLALKVNRVLKPGDLIQVANWCVEKGRLGHVIKVYGQEILILLMDEAGLGNDPIYINRGNCILITKKDGDENEECFDAN